MGTISSVPLSQENSAKGNSLIAAYYVMHKNKNRESVRESIVVC